MKNVLIKASVIYRSSFSDFFLNNFVYFYTLRILSPSILKICQKSCRNLVSVEQMLSQYDVGLRALSFQRIIDLDFITQRYVLVYEYKIEMPKG